MLTPTPRRRRGIRFLDDVFDDTDPQRAQPAPLADARAATQNGTTAAPDMDDDDLQEERRRLEERRRRARQRLRSQRVNVGAMQAPTADRRRSRINQIVTGAGAITSLVGALAGSQVATMAGAGLARGGQRNLERQRQSLRRRQQTFRETVAEGQLFNRQLDQTLAEENLDDISRQQGALDEEAEAKRDQQREIDLIELKDRLEKELSPMQKKELQKELDLLDQRIDAQRALAEERRAGAESDRALAERRSRPGSGSGAGDERPYSDLSTERIRQLKQKTEATIERETQLDRLGRPSIKAASQAELDRASETLNSLNAELERRQGERNARADGIEDRETFLDTMAPEASRVQPDRAALLEMQLAREKVRDGGMTPREFEILFGQPYEQ